MFSINDLRLWTAVGILSTVVALPTASAGHRHGSRCAKPDVDIEKLKARLRHTCGQWRLSVKYEVDTEDATPGRFDLIFRVTERAHGTRGRARRPRIMRKACLVPFDADCFKDGIQQPALLQPSLGSAFHVCPHISSPCYYAPA